MKNPPISRRQLIKLNSVAFVGLFVNASCGFLPTNISKRFIFKVESSFAAGTMNAFENSRASHENTNVIVDIIRRYSSEGLLIKHYREDEIKDSVHSVRWIYEFSSKAVAEKFQQEVYENRTSIWPTANSDSQYHPKELGYVLTTYPVYRFAIA